MHEALVRWTTHRAARQQPLDDQVRAGNVIRLWRREEEPREEEAAGGQERYIFGLQQQQGAEEDDVVAIALSLLGAMKDRFSTRMGPAQCVEYQLDQQLASSSGDGKAPPPRLPFYAQYLFTVETVEQGDCLASLAGYDDLATRDRCSVASGYHPVAFARLIDVQAETATVTLAIRLPSSRGKADDTVGADRLRALLQGSGGRQPQQQKPFLITPRLSPELDFDENMLYHLGAYRHRAAAGKGRRRWRRRPPLLPGPARRGRGARGAPGQPAAR